MSVPYIIIDAAQECVSTGKRAFEIELVSPQGGFVLAGGSTDESGLYSGCVGITLPDPVYSAPMSASSQFGQQVATKTSARSKVKSWFGFAGRWATNKGSDAPSYDAKRQAPYIEARSDRLLRDTIKKWSEPLSNTVESVTVEEIRRVFQSDASICRALITFIEEDAAVIRDIHESGDFSDETLLHSFEKLREKSRQPLGFYDEGILFIHLGVTLFSAALKALPHAESLEKATQLDRAFPQVARDYVSRRF